MMQLCRQRLHVAASLALIGLGGTANAAGSTVEGVDYPDVATVADAELKLVGAGLREKWFVDVYTMGAYTQSGMCAAAALTKNDEPKYLRIDMLRDVSGEKMASALEDAFTKNTPKDAPEELKKQVNTFLSYFKEAKKGSRIEFTYLPGQGTRLLQNGQEPGPPLQGKLFADLLWNLYFGQKSCCSGLKKQILEGCS